MTFTPDGFSHGTFKHPIEKTAPLWLEWIELEHLQDQDITVTFLGKYQINDNQF